ncbi:MAG: ATP-binding protein [Atopobiaceae bacterium]|jgi:signal transduction histidine kinase/PAS domain-containing protein/ActR/RegA family two-component response regulator|nr:ATP-binding protein [Atopobiaceae bacterium]
MGFALEDIERFANLLPGAFAIYQVHPEAMTMPYFSESVPSILGFTREEYERRVTGDNLRLVFEGDRDYIRRNVAGALESGRDVEISYRVIMPGGYHWMYVRGKVMGEQDGCPLVLVEFLDTTRETRAHSDMLDHSKTAIYVIDANTHELLYLNRSGERFWGCDDGYLGHTCHEHFQGHARPCADCPVFGSRESVFRLERSDWPCQGRHTTIDVNRMAWYGRDAWCVYLEDVSEERRTEASLAQANARMAKMIDSLPVSVIVYRKRGELVTMEEVSESSSDVSGDLEAVGRTGEDNDQLLREYVHPDDLAQARSGFAELFSERHEATFTYRNRVEGMADYRWLQGRGRSFLQEDGSEIAYVVFTDVSASEEARIAAERQLDDERLRMRSLEGDILSTSCFNVTRDRPIELNNDENLRYEKVEDDSVEREAEAVDRRIAVQDKETKSVLLCAAKSIPDAGQRKRFLLLCSHAGMMDAYAQGRRELSLEYRRQTGRGLIWVETRIVLLPDPKTGDVIAFFYTTDIDEAMTQRLVNRRIISSAYEFVTLIDVAKRQNRLINVTMEATAPHKFLDYDRDTAYAFRRIVDPDDYPRVIQEVSLDTIVRVLAGMPEYIVTFSIRTPDGRRLRKQMRYGYLDEARGTILSLGTDITESTRLEERRNEELSRALQEAKSANEAKSEFLSRMSHDIRTPMNGIMGMTRIAREYDNPPGTVECLDKIDTSSSFLLGLVNDILDLSKVESGRMELHLEPYTAAEFFTYLDTLIRPLCDEKGIAFEATGSIVNEATPLMDKLRVNQVFFNLLSNAVKFTPEGGGVTLHVDETLQPDGRMRLDGTVSDTGIGMSKEFQRHLFEPFTQESRADRAAGQGSGLGLSIVKNLLDLMGGTISVESEPGKGSTFRLCAAFDVTDRRQDAVAAPSRGRGNDDVSGLHVLVCEDHLLNAEIVTHLLGERGAIVTLAEDGKRGLEAFEASPVGFYDIILMDVRMPVMNGLEATRAIRSLDRPDARTVPIVAMTANAYAEDVRDCRNAGMDEHIAKPFDPDHLFGAIARLARAGRTALNPGRGTSR